MIEPAPSKPERLLHKVPDAAAALSVGISTVWKLIADGKLQVVKIGRSSPALGAPEAHGASTMTQLAHNDGASGVQAGLDSGPPRFTCRDLVHGYTTADIEADRAQVGWYSSLTRVIEGAPRQNKLTVFSLLARESAAYSAAHRQRVIDELWEIATSFGLVDLFDTASVQDTISVAFDDGPPMGMVPRKPAESPYPQTVSDEDDYDGLGRSFARACRDADREYRQAPRSPAKRANNRLPESTRQAVEWLLKNNDAERLKDFIAEHSPSEAQVIVGYIKGRRS